MCPFCLGLSVVRKDLSTDHPKFGQLFPCQCAEGDLSHHLRKASGLTGFLETACFEDYHHEGRERQYDAVQRLLKQGNGWLTLYGGYGRGKTYLLAAAVNHYLKKSKPAVYVSASGMLDSLRDSYGHDRFDYVLRQWQTCRVLALDEVDQYHKTPWASDKFRRLLDHRYALAADPVSRNSVTLFASNTDPKGSEWPEDLTWLADRMSEGRFQIVETEGPSMRPLQKGEML